MAENDHDPLQKHPMEFIWDRIPKMPDGIHVRYLKNDVPYLYAKGFVDSTVFTMDQWMDALKPFLQSDGSYILTKENFLSLGHFRYVGPVYRPFDAMKVREGEWTEEQIERLYHLSIKPSTIVTHAQFKKLIEYFMKMPEHVSENGLFVVNQKLKRMLVQLVEMNPSPRRRMEMEVDKIRHKREVEMRNVQAHKGASQFTMGKTSSDVKKDTFAQMQSTSASEKKPTEQDGAKPDEGVDLKSLRKKSRGMISG